MTLTEMLSRVRTYLRDVDKQFITDDDITDWLNEAQRDIVYRLRLLQKEASGIMTGTDAFLATPADYIDIVEFRLGGTDVVEWVDNVMWEEWNQSGNIPVRTVGRVFNNQIQVYPTPGSTTTYRLRYYYEPADLTGAEESVLPKPMHHKMVQYATAEGYYKEDEVGLGDRSMQKYEDGLPPISQTREKMFPGPINLRYQPTPWDVEGSHRSY